MKTIKFLSLASAALLLTACSSEEPVNVGGENNGDVKSYVKISLKTGNGTRAEGDEETTTANESTIDNVVLGFYVGDSRVDVRELTNLNWQPGTGDIENYATTTLVTSVAPGTAGVKVVALANVDKDQMPASLTTFAKDKRDYKNGDSFVMSSSLGNDGSAFVYYTTLKSTDFVEENAELTGKGAEIYIERLAAKVNVANDADGFKADHSGLVDMDSFTFVPDFWVLSGQPTNVFTIKQTGYSTIAEATSAMSATLMAALYPESSYRSSWALGSTDNIKSVAYEDITDDNKNQLAADAYAYENAYNDFTAVNSEELSETNTFVVVVGHYDVKDEGGQQVDDLYLFGFTEKDGKSVAAAYTDGEKLIEAACKMAGKDKIAGLSIKPLTVGTAAIFNGEEQYIETTAIPQIRYYSNGAKGFYVKNIHHIYGDDYLYGVVRNHYYKMTLKGATGLATPIADPSKPLIPETPDKVKVLQTTINVLDWKTMPNQDVQW